MEDNVTSPIEFTRKKIHNYGFLNTFSLKLIAIICMTIDHIGLCFGTTYKNGSYFLSGFMSHETYSLLRIIGRIAFPIFCYLIVEGLIYTKDIINYAVRLFVFALISQIPFSLMTRRAPLDFSLNLNVYFTLFLGLITIATIDYARQQRKRGILNTPIFLIISFVIILCSTTFADSINTDYAGFGIIIIVIFYAFRDKPLLISLGLLIAILLMSNDTELYALIALVPIILHNHSKGPSMKYVFYSYYPAHMLILYFISTALI